MNPSAAQALAYIDLGWRPIPIPRGKKMPTITDWPNLKVSRESVDAYFAEECNIGIILGDASGGLVDIDLDSPAAVALAPIFLVPTQVFGRVSKLRSHFIYVSRYARTEKFQALDGSMLVELRANGGLQTVFPDSVHPSGEAIEWDADYDMPVPFEIQAEDLRMRVARLAAAALLISIGWTHDRAVAFAQNPSIIALAGVEEKGQQRIARWLGLSVVSVPPRRLQSVPSRDAIMKRAREYMARVPGAIEGNGGHQQTWQGALNCIRGFDLDRTEAREILDEYNTRCEPPWSDKELEHKLDGIMNAHTAGRGWLLEERSAVAPISRSPSPINNQQDTTKKGDSADRPIVDDLPPFVADVASIEWATPLPPSIPTGLADLDAAIEGFHAEGAYVLVGPTGRGKSGLALQMSRAVAPHRSVLYLTSELSKRQVIARAASPLLRRSWGKLYRLPPDQSAPITEALQGLALRVVEVKKDTQPLDLANRIADKDGQAPFVVLDYLQHAARRLVPDDMRLATAALMDQMTEWAREKKSIALVLSSAGRAFQGGNESRGAMDFITASKESGDIEYDAAGVFFLDCDPCPPGGTSAARLHVAKSRFAGTGATVGLRFDGALGEFICDRSSALNDEHNAVLEAIGNGAETIDDVRKKLGVRKAEVVSTIKFLDRLGLIDRNPLRVKEQK